MYFSVFININQFLFGTTIIQLTKINQNKILALKDSLYGKLSFFTHFSKFVVFIRVM